MQVTELKADGLEREFRVAVPAAEIEQKVTSRLAELAKTIKMPGFRPGKVPVSLLRNRYGTAVLGEALEQTLSESTRSVISERGLKPAMQPKIEIVSPAEPGNDLEYTLALELLPEIEPVDYGKINLERLIAEPADSEIDEALERIAGNVKSSKPLEEDRAALPGDMVVVDYVGRIDGQTFEGGQAEKFELELGSNTFIPGFEDQLVGVRPGDDRQVNVTFPEEFPGREVAGKDAVFDVHVHEIRETAPSAIDDALAAKMGLDDVDALRREIRDARQREYRQVARMRLKRALLDALDKQYRFEVPKGMLEKEFESIARQLKDEEPDAKDTSTDPQGARQEHDHDHAHDHDHDHAHDHDHDHEAEAVTAGLSEEKVAEYRRIAERRVRLGLVLAEVGRANNLQVTQEELSRAMVAEARRFPGQERKVLDFFQEHPEAREGLAGPILEEKVVDFLLEMGTVTDRSISPEEFMEADEEESAGSPQAEGKTDGLAAT